MCSAVFVEEHMDPLGNPVKLQVFKRKESYKQPEA